MDKSSINIGNNIIFTLNNDELSFILLFHNGRKTYSNELYDITMIELTQNDALNDFSFLEIDDNIFIDKPNDYYQKNIFI